VEEQMPKPPPERSTNERRQPKISPRRELTETPPAAAPRHSRRTPDEQTRLFINAGQEMSVGPEDVLAKILGETGLPRKAVGAIDVRERHLFVDVASEHVQSIVSQLNRTQLKGRRLKVKVA
jgi:ATP-dependent RNA helicase DeaD